MSRKKKPMPRPPTKSKPLQLSLEQDKLIPDLEDVTPIIEFLENFRNLSDPRAQHPSKLISLKVPEPLLAAFRFKAEHEGVPYQTMIKKLMVEWLKK